MTFFTKYDKHHGRKMPFTQNGENRLNVFCNKSLQVYSETFYSNSDRFFRLPSVTTIAALPKKKFTSTALRDSRIDLKLNKSQLCIYNYI